MFRTIDFPIRLARSIDPIILGARVAVADVFRNAARGAMNRASEGGIDGGSAAQRVMFDYVQACQASQFIRRYPPSAARWAFQVEQDTRALATEGFPPAPDACVGCYGHRWLTLMPNNMVLVDAGGVKASAVLPEDARLNPQAIREVRLFKNLDGDWSASLVIDDSAAASTGGDDELERELLLEGTD